MTMPPPLFRGFTTQAALHPHYNASPAFADSAAEPRPYAELTPLASEWWHFNDLSTRSQVLDNQGIGDFLISSVRSAAPA